MESLINLVETELSEQTLNALREFYREEAGKRLISADSNTVEEDWELSQFWYDEKTAETLSNIALKAAGENGSIACVSSPTVFATLWKRKENFKAKLFEYDKRFQDLYGEYFIFYDYNKPLNIPEEMKSAFDVVIVDPPYLSKECLEKTAQTVKLLSKQYIILCTGAIMEEFVGELLGLKACNFRPCHKNKLGNEFKCFANFDLDKFATE